ncbi:hypothetical protein F4604DRAFT_1771221 [Suillus subluteus]|nr:hypothetical protein F4604DRAFT_1776748 [Suillus subluteus]KAG1870880.1 hypothetical protein F4604DRAFT_1771221 [Suillus subluteus]
MVGEPTLEKLWQEVAQENGWKKRNDRLFVHFLGIMVGQILVFLMNIACTIEKPPIQNDNHDTYRKFMSVSYLCSFLGLFVPIFYTKIIYTKVELFQKMDNGTSEVSETACRDVMGFITFFRMIQLNLVYSFTSLISAFGALFLGSLLQGWSGFVWTMVSLSSAVMLDDVLMKNVRRLLDGLVD